MNSGIEDVVKIRQGSLEKAGVTFEEIQKQYHIVGQLLARLTIIRVFVLAATIIFSRPAKLFLVLVI